MSKDLSVHSPLRISSTDPPPTNGGNGNYDDYFQRLIKLVPAEIISLYLTLKGFYNTAALDKDWMVWVVPPVCFSLLVVLRIKLTGRQWISVAVSACSFVVWLGATGDPLMLKVLKEPRAWSALVAIWTFVVPLFYKG